MKFHNSSIALLCTAKEAFIKQTAFNNICTEVSSKLFNHSKVYILSMV